MVMIGLLLSEWANLGLNWQSLEYLLLGASTSSSLLDFLLWPCYVPRILSHCLLRSHDFVPRQARHEIVASHYLRQATISYRAVRGTKSEPIGMRRHSLPSDAKPSIVTECHQSPNVTECHQAPNVSEAIENEYVLPKGTKINFDMCYKT